MDVRPWGVEPQSLEPESSILSIELWAHGLFANANANLGKNSDKMAE